MNEKEREKERKTQPNDDDDDRGERANKERVLLCALIVYYESASEPQNRLRCKWFFDFKVVSAR